MTAESIGRGLGLKRAGRTWRGACPIHGGSSFTVSEKDGKPMFFCWSGCNRGAILSELKRRGLWPERERREFTPTERRDWARAKRDAGPLARAALRWWMARMSEVEDQKREAVGTDNVDIGALVLAAREAYRLQSLSPEGVVLGYIRARTADPHGTRELVRLGETWERVCRTVTLTCLTRPAEGCRAT
jgi:hypothetical protein